MKPIFAKENFIQAKQKSHQLVIKLWILFFSCIPAMIFSQQQSDKVNTHRFGFQQAIDFGSINNYDVKSADYDVKKSNKRLWEAVSRGLPQISGSARYQSNIKLPVTQIPSEVFRGKPGTFTEVTFVTKQNMSAHLMLNQLIFSGNYLVAVQSSKVYKKIALLSRKRTQIEIKSAIAQAYINALISEENANLIEKNIEVAKKNLNESSQSYKAGFVELQAVEQLQLSLAQLESAYKRSKGLIDISKNNLKFAMGIPIKDKIILSDTISELLAQDLIPSLATQPFELNGNIDYQISQNKIKANKLLVKLNKSNALPTLSSSLEYTYLKNSNRFPLWESDFDWNPSLVLTLNLNIPIFSSFKRRAQRQQAEIEFEKAQLTNLKTEEKVKLEVKTQKISYNNAVDSYYTAKQNMDLAEKIYKKETVKYFEGVSTSNDLRQSESQFYKSQSDYINAISDLLNAKTNLDKALNKL